MPTIKAGCFLVDIKTNNIALIYREKQKDYSFPKGHLESGETIIQCAIRETEEETKRVPKIIEQISPYIERYTTPSGEECECYLFVAIDNGKSKNTSTDTHELVWTPLEKVESTLSYESLKHAWNSVRPAIESLIKNS